GVYSRRPKRPIDYLSLTRVLPAYEISGLVRNFTTPANLDDEISLTDEFLGYLSTVMGRKYTSADVMDKRGMQFQQCTLDAGGYTAFNMGGGEASIIALLYMLQSMPRGGMLVVDEIEAGLHMNAQRRLVGALTIICKTKQIQIICSTHSEYFIDSLPRIARIVLKKDYNTHNVVETPSTRYAMYEMDGRCKPELTIYCEDKAAKAMIEAAVSHDQLIRLKIIPIGSDNKVATQGVSHHRSDFEMRCLCVFDGDVEQRNIDNWVRSERGERTDIEIESVILPGDGLPPERWIAEQLAVQSYRQNFAEEFNIVDSDVAVSHIDAIRVTFDHHSLGFTLSQRLNYDEESCLSKTMRAVAPIHPQLDDLRQKISELIG
ncbi:MAG: ATP-binding protein, partial [Cellvibrionaceae bacterium]|nr:ATP-binding protein [Cellvibrionaceae bacterium]